MVIGANGSGKTLLLERNRCQFILLEAKSTDTDLPPDLPRRLQGDICEDRRVIRRSDSNAGVADRDLDSVGQPLAADHDVSAVARELDCIGQQIQHDLAEFSFVGDRRPKLRIDIDADGRTYGLF